MREMTRDQLARHLFNVMNQHRVFACTANSAWQWMVDNKLIGGYLRLADEIVSKGYKP